MGRLLRLVKVIRREKALESLNQMIYGIVNCCLPLFWAVLILILIMYACAVFFMSGVASYLAEIEFNEMSSEGTSNLVKGLEESFGTMYKSLVLLFKAVTGGADWGDLSTDLKTVSEGYFLVFSMYIVFVTLGVLNILTGFFVDSSIENSLSCREEMFEIAHHKKTGMIELLREVFLELDKDGSGSLSYEELDEHINAEDLKPYLEVFDLSPGEMKELFAVLDWQNLGEVDINEFVDGCLRSLGQPKNKDLCQCLLQGKHMVAQLDMIGRQVKRLEVFINTSQTTIDGIGSKALS